MVSPWASAAALLLVVWGSGRLDAQEVRELGWQAVATAADEPGVVAGPVAAIRPSSRVRASLGVGAGVAEGDLLWRAELLGHFLLSPRQREGVGVYGVGGVAAVAGALEQGYLVLALGVEARPGSRSGWAIEAGIGGGARLSVGYRWRWR